jgi:uncharacterized glyoxalase superfamily protein PhnB
MELVPLLAVRDTDASIEYYVNTLGFVLAARYPAEGVALWAHLQREGVSITIGPERDYPGSEAVAVKGVGVQLYIDTVDRNIDSLHTEFTNRQVEVVMPVTLSGTGAIFSGRWIYAEAPE